MIRASQDLHVNSILSFPNANKKVYFNPYVYAKATNNPKKSKKSTFFVTRPVPFIGNY